MSVIEIIIARISNAKNLYKCFNAQGLYDPSAAEQRPAAPIKAININKELIDILFKPTQGEGAPEAFRGFINLFDDYLAPDLLKQLDNPVHLIWGEKDPWEPVKEAQKWFETFECIKSLDIINDAGHWPHDEMPEKVNPILTRIIQEAI